MSNNAIVIENISKQFHIGGLQSGYRTFRESLVDIAVAPARRVAALLRGNVTGAREMTETFWALRDVSFDVKHGDVVGIIGRNGAGKSTLLKILSRITEPTKGRITLYGRVGALLEVGTGFHPELTGRENIFLNGAILGMGRHEIGRKFDEIVEFAEIEKFIDTPAKHYSSGMYMRLAFAVAAHLEPEILIVDEVLAVGDAEFQKKSLGKMNEVAQEGRTVLFVSHNMGAINELCSKVYWLKSGQLVAQGNTAQIVNQYLRDGNSDDTKVIFTHPQNDYIQFKNIGLFDEDHSTTIFDVTKPFTVQFEYELFRSLEGLEVSFRVRNTLGVIIFTANRSNYHKTFKVGSHTSLIEVPALSLVPGAYVIDMYAHVPYKDILIHEESIIAFEIEETGSPMQIYNDNYGVVFAPVTWRDA